MLPAGAGPPRCRDYASNFRSRRFVDAKTDIVWHIASQAGATLVISNIKRAYLCKYTRARSRAQQHRIADADCAIERQDRKAWTESRRARGKALPACYIDTVQWKREQAFTLPWISRAAAPIAVCTPGGNKPAKPFIGRTHHCIAGKPCIPAHAARFSLEHGKDAPFCAIACQRHAINPCPGVEDVYAGRMKRHCLSQSDFPVRCRRNSPGGP